MSQLAAWLKDNGFRTRNMDRLPDAVGNFVSGPRLFTTASARGILHKSFYTGSVRHRGRPLPGVHLPLVSREVFDLVQDTMRKNCGRSETLNPRPTRQYLLKDIVRCAHCGMPMSARTYKNGHANYREHKASRSLDHCPTGGGSIPCQVPDDQVRRLAAAIELGPKWLEEVLAIVDLKDEVGQVGKKRQAVLEKLRRMAKACVDGLFPEDEYRRQETP